MNKVLFALLLPLICLASPEDQLLSRHNQNILNPLQKVLQNSSVVITNAERLSVGYGCLVSSEGHILTKASLINDPKKIFIRFGKKEYKPELINTSEEWDVSLLKIDITDASPLDLAAPPQSSGNIVACNGVTGLLKRRLKFGIIAAKPRAIPFQESALDLKAYPDMEKKGFIVEDVKPDGEASKSGIQKGDLIVELNGTELTDFDMPFNALFKGMWPGEKVTLKIKRKEQEVSHALALKWLHEVSAGPQDRNESISGRISVRRTGFPAIIQHDIALSSRTIGGPLLNLDGKCIGMNIARFSRSETYAIPSNIINLLLQEWKVPE